MLTVIIATDQGKNVTIIYKLYFYSTIIRTLFCCNTVSSSPTGGACQPNNLVKDRNLRSCQSAENLKLLTAVVEVWE